VAKNPRPLLEDAAVVVRGGSTKNRNTAEADAQRAQRLIGVHGLSGNATGEADVAAVLQAAEIPHGTARATTAGRLRAAGLDAVPTGKHPHVTIVMPEPITDEAWHGFQDAFDAPQPNPYAKRHS
jgi:hypothetical protein